jgi:cathepsin B
MLALAVLKSLLFPALVILAAAAAAAAAAQAVEPQALVMPHPVPSLPPPPPSLHSRRHFLGVRRDLALRARLLASGAQQETAAAGEGAVLPTAFDARERWPRCIHPIRDQGQCGSCWAFGTSEAFSDRLCIASAGRVNVVLSTEQLLDCNAFGLESSCKGGDQATASEYIIAKGLVSDECYPYTKRHGGNASKCQKQCSGSAANRSWVPHKAKAGSLRWLITERGIQQEIFSRGPVVSCFAVYSDFQKAGDGRVYAHGANATTKGTSDGHCIKMLGWGTQPANASAGTEATPYWLIANSWGTSWGILGGYFKMVRGANEGDIEREAFSLQPELLA